MSCVWGQVFACAGAIISPILIFPEKRELCYKIVMSFSPICKVDCDDCIKAPKYPWYQKGLFSSFDHASVRRGYQVYKEVCAACHSVDISYRHLVGVCLTEDEAKAEAANVEVEDGPDEAGEMFLRPGKIVDRLPKPYKNEEEARAANGGAVPPPLTLMTKARPGGADYVFSLITGYSEPPPGIEMKGNLSYNKYFPGTAIAMAQNLFDGVVEYEDGTVSSASQMAKDVTTFLNWTAEPEMEERKIMGTKALLITVGLSGFLWYWKRMRWSYIKSSRFLYRTTPKSTTKRPTSKK